MPRLTINTDTRNQGTANSIRLRAATPADLQMLQRWDEQPHVIDSDPNDDWNWETELQRSPPWREMLIAELNNRPIGVVQIIDPFEEETRYWGNIEPNLRAVDIWIGEADCLNKGYGTQMMQLALDRCFENGLVEAVLIDPLVSNTKAIRFYERIGFKRVGERRFNDDDCMVMRLGRKDWQR